MDCAAIYAYCFCGEVEEFARLGRHLKVGTSVETNSWRPTVQRFTSEGRSAMSSWWGTYLLLQSFAIDTQQRIALQRGHPGLYGLQPVSIPHRLLQALESPLWTDAIAAPPTTSPPQSRSSRMRGEPAPVLELALERIWLPYRATLISHSDW